MISRFFRRLWVAAQFVGRVVHADATGVYRISPRTAWELACVYHPSPARAARDAADTAEAIAWARRLREERD